MYECVEEINENCLSNINQLLDVYSSSTRYCANLIDINNMKNFDLFCSIIAYVSSSFNPYLEITINFEKEDFKIVVLKKIISRETKSLKMWFSVFENQIPRQKCIPDFDFSTESLVYYDDYKKLYFKFKKWIQQIEIECA